jgi:hypothetical protein
MDRKKRKLAHAKMLTCKQVSKSLSEKDYQDLPPLKKFMLKLHVALCIVCGKFNRQVMESQDMCRHYKNRESELESLRPKLDETRKKQLKKLIDQENESLRIR